MSKSSQKNTLFNYFGKSPQGQGTPKRERDSSPATAGNSSTPRRPALKNNNESNETPKIKVKRGFSQSKTPQSTGKKGDHQLGLLVWSKLDGYPVSKFKFYFLWY